MAKTRTAQSARVDKKTKETKDQQVATQPEGAELPQAPEEILRDEALGAGCGVTIGSLKLTINPVKEMDNLGDFLWSGFYPEPKKECCGKELPEGGNFCPACGKRAGTKGNKAGTAAGVQKYTLFGHSASGVLKWLGKNGVQPARAKRILAAHGLQEVSDHTVTTQLRDGRKGAKSADLKAEEIEKLLSVE